jgi:hypothetical protein
MPSPDAFCAYTLITGPILGLFTFCVLRTYNSFMYRERDESIHVVVPSHTLQRIHTTEPLHIAEPIERIEPHMTQVLQIAEAIPIDATLLALQHSNQEALYI